MIDARRCRSKKSYMKMDVRLFGNLRCKCFWDFDITLVKRSSEDDGFVANRTFAALDNPWPGFGLLLTDARYLKES